MAEAGCRRPDGHGVVVEDLGQEHGEGTLGGLWTASEAGRRGGYSRIVGRVEGGQWERRPCWAAFLWLYSSAGCDDLTDRQRKKDQCLICWLENICKVPNMLLLLNRFLAGTNQELEPVKVQHRVKKPPSRDTIVTEGGEIKCNTGSSVCLSFDSCEKNGEFVVPVAISRHASHVWMHLHFQGKCGNVTGIPSLPKLLSLKVAHESRT